jgi:hypothetical protein
MAYENMTPDQREQRRKQQRLYNQAPSRKKAMKATTSRSREAHKHTLNSESIAMENPLFNPTTELPTANSSGPHGPTTSPSEWDIPESTATPIRYPQATNETNDDDHDKDDCGDIFPSHTSGEHADENTPLPQSTVTNNGK